MNEISKKPSSPSKLLTDNEPFDNPNTSTFNKQNSTTLDYLQKTSNKYLQSPQTSPNQSPLLQHKPLSSPSSTLCLYIVNSNKEQKGTFLLLTPCGAENGLRGVQDGTTYFGFEEKPGDHGIDYVIKPKEDNYDSRFVGKHFQIKFNTNDMKYYLKDLGHGFGTFIKVISWTKIMNNMLINIGENYIVFTFGESEELVTSENYGESGNSKETADMINVKVFSGNVKHYVMSFSPHKSPVTMGRNQECDILIDDSMLSRIHCTIEYKHTEGGWFISDGQLMERNAGIKKSTNGTWVYAFDNTAIEEGMVFKANHNLFTCSFNKGGKYDHMKGAK